MRKYIIPVAAVVLLLGVAKLTITIAAPSAPSAEVASQGGPGKYSIVVNTFRRNDLLQRFLKHYITCRRVHTIYVVWSDQKNEAPDMVELVGDPEDVPIVVLKYDKDSLNNRFKPIPDLETEALLSIDDDQLISCDSVEHAFVAWQSSPRVLVGWVPRLHEANGGAFDYLGWWTVWWRGLHSIILTKSCFLHRDYLKAYTNKMPEGIHDYIDKHRNCEDIAMSFIVAREARAPSIWVKGSIVEMDGHAGISSKPGHIEARSQCLTDFTDMFGEMPLVVSPLKAVLGKGQWWW